jgi:signal transduction histidine kinase
MQQLAHRAPFALLISVVFAAVSAVFLSYRLPGLQLLYWWLAVVACCIPPAIYLTVLRYRPFNENNIGYYRTAHSVNSMVSGLTWGLGMVYLNDLSSDYTIAISILILVAFSTAAISVLGEFPRSYFVASGGALIPLGVYYFMHTDYPGRLLGFLPVSILFIYTMVVMRISRGYYREAATFLENRAILDRLQLQKETVQNINEQKSRFLAATSHDMAQPLDAQAAYIAALGKVLDTREQRELLGKIEDSRINLDNMLDSLSEISRLDAQVIVPNSDRFVLSELVASVVDEFADAARRKSVRIHADLEPWRVETDRMLFARIIRNVLSNAIKYSRRQGEIRIDADRKGTRILLTIRDNGVGVAAEQHEAIFEDYVQLATPRRGGRQGTGLGLSIVKRLSELLEVEMTFDSQPGEGTCFQFSLRSAETPSQPRKVATEEKAALQKSVLVISRDRITLDSMSILLSGWRCEVYTALSVDEAVQLTTSLDIVPDAMIVSTDNQDSAAIQCSIEKIRKKVSMDMALIVTTDYIDEVTLNAPEGNLTVIRSPASEAELHTLLSQA